MTKYYNSKTEDEVTREEFLKAPNMCTVVTPRRYWSSVDVAEATQVPYWSKKPNDDLVQIFSQKQIRIANTDIVDWNNITNSVIWAINK